jgi:hypothetical protein
MEEQVNLQEFKDNLSKMSNEKLCEVIVSHRYLGILKDQAVLSMEELSARRVNGDQFHYEKHIDELFSTLPKINIDLNSIMKKMNMDDLKKQFK